MTIHVTPEPEFSYVSFESNVSSSNYYELINRVIDTFQPGKFIVTIFANKVSDTVTLQMRFKFNFDFTIIFQTSPAQTAARELDHTKMIGEWQRRDIQYCRFQTYDLTYAHYSKFPSWGLQVKPYASDAGVIKNQNTSFPHPYSYNPFPFLPLPSYLSTQFSSLPQKPSFNWKQLNTMLRLNPSSKTVTFSLSPSSAKQTLIDRTKPTTPEVTIATSYSTHKSSTIHNHNATSKLFDLSLIFTFLMIQIISWIFFVDLDEYSPLILFSWWRNKISWKCPNLIFRLMII